jgi:hypothetical protein
MIIHKEQATRQFVVPNLTAPCQKFVSKGRQRIPESNKKAIESQCRWGKVPGALVMASGASIHCSRIIRCLRFLLDFHCWKLNDPTLLRFIVQDRLRAVLVPKMFDQ